MRPYLIIFLLCWLGIEHCDAQRLLSARKVQNYRRVDNKMLHFGFCVGLNTLNASITPSVDGYMQDTLWCNISKPSLGFQIQALGVLRLNDYLDLRFAPGVLFGERDVRFYKRGILYNDKQRLESSYVELPILLKFHSDRLNNFRAYLTGGLNPRIDLARTYREDDGIYMDLQRFDPAYEGGGGIELYFPYFKLSLELRGSWGILNSQKLRTTPHPEFQNAVDKMKSSAFMFSIYIE